MCKDSHPTTPHGANFALYCSASGRFSAHETGVLNFWFCPSFPSLAGWIFLAAILASLWRFVGVLTLTGSFLTDWLAVSCGIRCPLCVRAVELLWNLLLLIVDILLHSPVVHTHSFRKKGSGSKLSGLYLIHTHAYSSRLPSEFLLYFLICMHTFISVILGVLIGAPA